MITYRDMMDQNPWWHEHFIPEECRLPQRAFFQELKKGLEHHFVQILLGMRRVGKSTLLRQLIGDLIANGVNSSQILYFSFDRYAVEKTPAALETVLSLYLERVLRQKIYEITKKTYIFIDEIQYLDYWEDIIKRFYDQNKRLKFILTGSQSTKLRGKSKESLAGRLLEYHLPPLTFREYLVITGKDAPQFPDPFDIASPDLTGSAQGDLLARLQDFHYKFGQLVETEMPFYLCCGQFPEIAREADIDLCYKYIQESVLGKILESDLPSYYNVERVEVFKAMGYHLFTNSGSLFELNNIGSDLGISKVTAEKYLGYLKDGSLIDVMYNYTRADIKKGRSLKKAYSTSTNFISAINKFTLDYYESVPEVFGRLIETYVWRQLSQRFENLTFWRKRNEEIDFLARDSQDRIIPVEVKFTKRIRNIDMKPLINFAQKHDLSSVFVLTRNQFDTFVLRGKQVYLIPYYLI